MPPPSPRNRVADFIYSVYLKDTANCYLTWLKINTVSNPGPLVLHPLGWAHKYHSLDKTCNIQMANHYFSFFPKYHPLFGVPDTLPCYFWSCAESDTQNHCGKSIQLLTCWLLSHHYHHACASIPWNFTESSRLPLKDTTPGHIPPLISPIMSNSTHVILCISHVHI